MSHQQFSVYCNLIHYDTQIWIYQVQFKTWIELYLNDIIYILYDDHYLNVILWQEKKNTFFFFFFENLYCLMIPMRYLRGRCTKTHLMVPWVNKTQWSLGGNMMINVLIIALIFLNKRFFVCFVERCIFFPEHISFLLF